MSIWTVIGIIALLAVVVFLKRGSGKRPAAPAPAARAVAPQSGRTPKRDPETEDKFIGVTVFAEKDACAGILKLVGKTFPEDRAPRIPVETCDKEKCECRLHRIKGRRHFPRRVKHDRRGDIRFGEERRDHHDRRQGIESWERPVD